ncbi:hypothetical protein PsorP6_002160 [Peronosclerospora sorghi]|uniref:Uncharacterized protein n=1 Tax=Peronosclerospora sorghi TaxID=230839 RepID=A0ACC0WRC6_9STRA|nr:hypothetical protein PsorP6_002160 [Peronosclerospora sorghi]
MSRTPFKPAHELIYGLKVMHIDPATKRIFSVRCHFCGYIEKEYSGESRARKQTNRIKTWESFRPELYESHHKGQHATHWSAYQALDHDAKKFFDNVQPHANTLHSHFGSRDQPMSFVLHRGVIEVIITDVFFNPDDHGSVSHQQVPSLFVPEVGSDNAVQHYTRMLHQIDLVVKERVNNRLGGELISTVNKIADSLRKQENLIRERGSKCPKMTTRWIALGSWSQWQLQHNEQLKTFFSSRRTDQVRPPEWYCPIFAALFALFETVNRTMKALKNRNLLMTHKRMEICSMIDRIKKMKEVEGPLTDEVLQAKYDNEFSGDWTILMNLSPASSMTKDCGFMTLSQNLSEDNQLLVKREVEQLITGFVFGVSRICTIRT